MATTNLTEKKIRKIFEEMLKKHEELLTGVITDANTVLMQKLDGLSREVADIKSKVRKIEKTQYDLQHNIEVMEEIYDEKIKSCGERMNTFIGETNNKLREIEDRSRRNNLRIDGVEEDEENETWERTKEKVKDLFER